MIVTKSELSPGLGLGLGMILMLVASLASGADLLETYHLAQAKDPTFDAARYSFVAAQEKRVQARAGLLPTVAVNSNDNRTQASPAFGTSAPMNKSVSAWTWNLQLTQPLLRISNNIAYQQSAFLVEQAEAQYALAEQELILRVAQAYFDILVAQEVITASDVALNAMREQWAQSKRGFETGLSAVTDVDEARSKLELARSQKVMAQNDLEIKRSELEKLVGDVPAQLSSLGTAILPQPQPSEAAAWVSQARVSNPSVRALAAALQAAEAEVQRNRAEHLPTLDFTASYGGNYSSGSVAIPSDYTTRDRSRQAGVQLNIPIYSGGATNSRVAEALANRYKSQAQLEEARRKAVAEARLAYAGVMNGLSQIEALESAVQSGMRAVSGNQVGYRAGIRINSDVLGAEQQLYNSQRDLVKARYDTLLQGLKLKAAAGVLVESDLMTINGLLVKDATGT
jgi:outer membrane protein